MTTIANCPNLSEAHLIQSVLMGSGIESFIPDELTAHNDWGIITAIGGIRVQVSDGDAEKALLILSELPEGSPPE